MALYDFIAVQGSRFLTNLNLTNSDGSYFILSGYSCSGAVRHRYSSENILLNLNPTVDTSYISGLITIDVKATGMAQINAGRYPLDIEIYTGVNDSIKIIRGNFIVSPDITP